RPGRARVRPKRRAARGRLSGTCIGRAVGGRCPDDGGARASEARARAAKAERRPALLVLAEALLHGTGPDVLERAPARLDLGRDRLHAEPDHELHLRRAGSAAREPVREWQSLAVARRVHARLLGSTPDGQHRLLSPHPEPDLARPVAVAGAPVAAPLGEPDAP